MSTTLTPSRQGSRTTTTTLVLESVVDRFGISPVVLCTGELRIGADVDGDVVVPQAGASSCMIVTEAGASRVFAGDSRIWLNNVPIDEAPLRSGDRLALGPVELRVRRALPEELELDAPVDEAEGVRDETAESTEVLVEEPVPPIVLPTPAPVEDARDTLRQHLAEVDRAIRGERERLTDAIDPIPPSAGADGTRKRTDDPNRRNDSPTASVEGVERRVQLMAEMLDELQLTVAENLVHPDPDEARDRELRLERVEARLLDRERKLAEQTEDHEQRRKEIETAERRLASRTESLDARERELERRDEQRAASDKRLESLRVELDERAAGFAERRRELDELEESLRTRQRDLDSASARVDERTQRLEERDAEVRGRFETIDERTRELDERERNVANTERSIETARTELQTGREALEAQRNDVAADQRRGIEEIEARRVELDERGRALEVREAELRERSDAVTERARELDERERRAEDDERAREAAQRTLESERANLTERNRELDEAAARLQADRTRLDEERKRFAAIEGGIDQLRSRLEEREVQLDRRWAELDVRGDELDAERRSLWQEEQRLADERTSLETERTEVAARANDLERRLEEVTRHEVRIDECTNELEDRGRELDERDAQIAAAREEGESSADRAAKKLAEERVALENQRAELEAAEREIERRCDLLAENEARLDARRAEIDEREAALAQSAVTIDEDDVPLPGDSGQFAIPKGGAGNTEADDLRAELDRAREERNAERERLAGELDELRARAEARDDEFEVERTRLADERGTIELKLERAREEWDAERERIAGELAELRGRAEARDEELASERADFERERDEFTATRDEADREQRDEREKLEALRAEIEELRAEEQAARDEQLTQLRTDREAAERSLNEERELFEREIAGLRDRAAARDGELALERTRLEEERAEFECERNEFHSRQNDESRVVEDAVTVGPIEPAEQSFAEWSTEPAEGCEPATDDRHDGSTMAIDEGTLSELLESEDEGRTAASEDGSEPLDVPMDEVEGLLSADPFADPVDGEGQNLVEEEPSTLVDGMSDPFGPTELTDGGTFGDDADPFAPTVLASELGREPVENAVGIEEIAAISPEAPSLEGALDDPFGPVDADDSTELPDFDVEAGVDPGDGLDDVAFDFTDDATPPARDPFADQGSEDVVADAGDTDEATNRGPSYLDGLALGDLFDEDAAPATSDVAEEVSVDPSEGLDDAGEEEPLSTDTDPNVRDLRSRLAEMFDMPGDAPKDVGGPEALVEEANESVVGNSDGMDAVMSSFDALDEESVDESPELATEPEAEGSHEDDSVQAYMERLLARNRRDGAPAATYAAPAPKPAEPERAPAPEPIAEEPIDSMEPVGTPEPKHRQDHAAVRANIDSLREVANLSARTAIASYTWKQLKGTILAKGMLFLVFAGLAVVLLSSPWWSVRTYGISGFVALAAAIVMGWELRRSIALLYRHGDDDRLAEDRLSDEDGEFDDRDLELELETVGDVVDELDRLEQGFDDEVDAVPAVSDTP